MPGALEIFQKDINSMKKKQRDDKQIRHAKVQASSPGFWKSNSRAALCLLLFSAVLYALTITYDFALDDAIYITQNDFTKQGFAGLPDILTKESMVGFWGQQKDLVVGGRYRPIALATYAINHAMFGLSPGFEHFINILLYGITALLLYYLMMMFFPADQKKPWYLQLGFVISMIYVVHPLHVEVVANIAQRMALFSFLFSILTTIFAIKLVEKGGIRNLIFLVLSFLLALFSKEDAITFLAVVPLSLYFFSKAKLQDYARILGGMGLATFAFLMVRYQVIGYFLGSGEKVTELLNDPFLEANPTEKFATIFYTLGLYLKLMIFPHPLTHDYYPKQIPIIGFSDWRAIVSLVLYGILGLIALIGIAKKHVVAYGIAFFVITLSVVSNLLFPVGSFMNERFVYMPSLGFAIILGYFLVRWLPSKIPALANNRKTLSILVGLIVFAYSARTLARVPAWKDNFTLFTTDVKTSTNSSKCNTSAGGSLLKAASKTRDKKKKASMQQDAIKYLKRGLDIYPDNKDSWLLLGNAYYDINKDYTKTFDAYMHLLEVNPDHTKVHGNISIMCEKATDQKDTKAIASFLEKVIKEYSPTNPKPYDELGTLYARKMNRLDDGIRMLEKAVELDPSMSGTLQDLGIAYGMKAQSAGDNTQKQQLLQKSLEHSLAAKELEPNNAKVLLNLGITYANMGNEKQSEFYMNRAFTIDPSLK